MFRLLPLWLMIGVMMQPAQAWGPRGHRLVARIAARYLDDHTQKVLTKILAGDGAGPCGQEATLELKLACVSVWADDVRRDRPETYNWHFTDIPNTAERYEAERDCRATAKGDCSIAALTRLQFLIADGKLKPQERAEALKFLIHFLGDLHQPLHNADDADMGGNGKRLLVFGEETSGKYTWNLHGLWDVGILERGGKTEEDQLAALLAALPKFQMPLTGALAAAQRGSVVTWSEEGHDLARDYAYALLPVPLAADTIEERGAKVTRYRVGQEYVDATLPVVEQQLRRGGVRLARVLRESLRLVAE